MKAPDSSQMQKLRAALVERGWEIVRTDAFHDWRHHEEWRIESRREAWGFPLRIVFELHDHRSPYYFSSIGVHFEESEASAGPVASLSYRGHFDDELPGFLDKLDSLRRTARL